jgi:cell division protein FtsW
MDWKVEDQQLEPARHLRAETLVLLRWVAIAGQTIAMLYVYFYLKFPFPIGLCFVAIATSSALNIALRAGSRSSLRLDDTEAAVLLAYDVIQLAALLYLTGGVTNAFAMFLLAPVMISAVSLPRPFTLLLGILMVAGLVFSMAGGPPEAERLHLPTFYFVNRQAAGLLPAIAIMFGVSLLSPRHIRRAALVLFLISLGLVVATLFFGQEVKGARRWIFGIQPSEFLKPTFVVLVAWAFAEGAQRKGLPGNIVALFLFPLTVAPLVLQPDFGQTMLISLVWAILFFTAGLHWLWVAGIGGLGVTSALLAYKFVPHVHARIQTFLEPPPPVTAGVPTNFQGETALESFISGSWFGKGPGEGTIKRMVPDSHTDYIFAVIGEEFGVLTCMALAALFAFIVVRSLLLASRNEDPFCRFAAARAILES